MSKQNMNIKRKISQSITGVITSILLGMLVMGSVTSQANAQATANDPATNLSIECTSSTQPALMGFSSNPTDANNGPLIIAGSYRLKVEPLTPSVADDLSGITLTGNTAQYTSLIMAENSVQRVGNAFQINLTFGFTGQEAISTTNDLFFINIPQDQNATITVESAELFGTSGANNVYVAHTPPEKFTYNTDTCADPATTTDPTVVNVPPEFTLTAPVSIDRGSNVNIVAQLSDVSTVNIQWTQVSGPSIAPTIDNDDTFLVSELNFDMPVDAPDDTAITFDVTVTNSDINLSTTKSITVQARGNLAGTADATTDTTTTTLDPAEQPANAVDPLTGNAAATILTPPTNTTPAASSAESTGQAGSAISSTVTPSSLHGTSNLTNTGPTETGVIVAMAAILLIGYRKLRKKMS
jgi:hypothetical protein